VTSTIIPFSTSKIVVSNYYLWPAAQPIFFFLPLQELFRDGMQRCGAESTHHFPEDRRYSNRNELFRDGRIPSTGHGVEWCVPMCDMKITVTTRTKG
jgi:hypothetical protein